MGGNGLMRILGFWVLKADRSDIDEVRQRRWGFGKTSDMMERKFQATCDRRSLVKGSRLLE